MADEDAYRQWFGAIQEQSLSGMGDGGVSGGASGGASGDPVVPHRRCFSHNQSYDHHSVSALLLANVIGKDTPSRAEPCVIELELVFHVLSPIPGLEHASDDQIINHLHRVAQRINADYAGMAANRDSARTDHPLFARSEALRVHKKRYGTVPQHVSEIRCELASGTGRQGYSAQSMRKTHTGDEGPHDTSRHSPWSDPVWVYQQYLELCTDTRIRFVHTGQRDRIRVQPHLAARLSALKLDDPQFADQIAHAVKSTEHGGSGRCMDAVNVWIVELPCGLLGYSTFPWDPIRPEYDGVCVSSRVAGTRFDVHDGVDYRRYDGYHTFTHELAHNLGLLHIFNQDIRVDPVTHLEVGQELGGVGGAAGHDVAQGEDIDGPLPAHCTMDGDFCLDTPNQRRATQGSPYHHQAWPIDMARGARPYLFMDFMDYSNDECMFLFTPQQRDRMRQVVMGLRGGLVMGGGGGGRGARQASRSHGRKKAAIPKSFADKLPPCALDAPQQDQIKPNGGVVEWVRDRWRQWWWARNG